MRRGRIGRRGREEGEAAEAGEEGGEGAGDALWGGVSRAAGRWARSTETLAWAYAYRGVGACVCV